jgi:hypothetical protein
LEELLQDTTKFGHGEWQIVHVKIESFGVLRASHEEDITVPKPSHSLDFFAFDLEKSFNNLVIGKRGVFVPVESVVSIPVLAGLVYELNTTVPAIELARVPGLVEVRHIILSELKHPDVRGFG